MARIVCVGEGMLELRRSGGGWDLGYGGDTLNTAIHLARLGNNVAFFAALGNDGFSLNLKARWQAEGLDTSLVLTHPTRQAGLYAIDTDPHGERSFTYWRDTSAARELFALPESETAAAAVGEQADLLYFSLITLAVLPPEGRERLLALAAQASKVAFDGNYRRHLWPNVENARAVRDAAIALADVGLPTLEDEQALGIATADAVAARWQELGCEETIVKLGEQGCRLPDGRVLAPKPVLRPVDTSGAGDAFNAGFLDARLNGASIQDAARAGHRLASWTIMRPGAIPGRDS